MIIHLRVDRAKKAFFLQNRWIGERFFWRTTIKEKKKRKVKNENRKMIRKQKRKWKKIIFENQRYYSFSRGRSISKIILENCCNQNNLNGTLSEKKKNWSRDWKKLTKEERRMAVIIKTIKQCCPRESIKL